MQRVFLFLVACTAAGITSGASAANDPPRSTTTRGPTAEGRQAEQRVEQLIAQLGDEQYAVRRRAEEDLLDLGPDAYDQLTRAEDNMDLEIAERARYIVQRMRVEWVRPEDSAEIRRTLSRYGDLPESERLKRISRLAELKDNEGLPALCRLARLEPSPSIARRAALALLKRDPDGSVHKAVAQACRFELGSSDRAPTVWIQLWLRELIDRASTLPDWTIALEAEAELLKTASPDTSLEIVATLMQRRLDMCNDLGLLDETTAALMRIVEIWETSGRAHSTANLEWALRWIIDSKRWDVLEKFQQLRGGELHGDRKLLYFLAAAEHGAGNADKALTLAKQALALPEADAENRVIVARALATLGRVDWAEWEYRHAVEELPQTSAESIEARREWAIWLHDGEQYKQAADVIQEFFDALAEDRQARSQFTRHPQGRDFLDSMSSRHDYYLACYHESRKEFDLQREALKRAADRYRDDPDVLIAMFRSPGADENFRKEALAKIGDMSQRYLALIEQDPDDPTLLNQWAWLVSNTEGDYAKAIECSRRSLELSPDEPSYLDTLGRCYYAVGDLENAIKSQRKAVELSPHYRIMQRQLKLFETELAAKQRN